MLCEVGITTTATEPLMQLDAAWDESVKLKLSSIIILSQVVQTAVVPVFLLVNYSLVPSWPRNDSTN